MKHALAILILSASVALGQPTLVNSDDIAAAKARSNHTGTQAHTTITGLGTAATADTSTVGGASKVLQMDANGDIQLGPYANDGVLGNSPGNVLIPKFRSLSFRDGSGVQGAMIYLWPDHSASYDELLFDVQGSHCFYWTTGMQLGSAVGGNHYIYRHSGYADAGNTMRQSVPDAYNTMTWTGGASVLNRLAIQAAPLDLSGTNSAFQFFRNTSLGGAQAVNGTKFAEIAPAGVWSAGTAPAFDTLTPGATITQTASKYKTVQAAKVTLDQATTLAITGAEAGMRGVIYVKQDATGSRTLTLPAGSSFASGFALSTTPFLIDRLTWEFDGTYYFWTVAAGIEQAIDTDAAAFIATTGATDDTALSEFVLGLKGMGLWTTSVCWPMRSTQNYGSGASLKSLGGLGTFDGTISGSPTWGAAGIAFDGVNDYISFATPGKSATLAEFTMFSVFDSDQTTNRFVLGGFQNSSTGIAPTLWAGGSVTGGTAAANTFYTLSLDGTSGNNTQGQLTSGNTGVMQTSTMTANASEILVWANTSGGAPTPVRANYWNNNTNWHMGVRNNAGVFGYWFVGDQAFNFFSTTKLTSAQHTALRTLYKTTLGVGLSLP